MGGDVGTHFCPWSKEGISVLQTAGSPSLSHTTLILFSCPPPHEGLIPLTSTEAPVMYPLSSDAKNATTSATSVGMVGEGQSYFLRYRLTIPTYFTPPQKKPLNLHQSLIPVRPFQNYYRFKALFKTPQILLAIHAHPQGPPCVPTESLQSPVKKHVGRSFFYGLFPLFFFIPHYVQVWYTYCLHCAQQSPSETSSDRLPSTHSLPCPSLSLAFSGSWALQ